MIARLISDDFGGQSPGTVHAAKGTAASAVATGHVGWYWEDNAGTANDRTIVKMNTDADAAPSRCGSRPPT